MDPLKQLRSGLERGIARAWETLTEGWRELLSRNSDALTHFARSHKRGPGSESSQEFPRWSLLAAEVWETAQSVIVRVELPGMKREDLKVSLQGNMLRIRGDKRSEGDHQERFYHLMERAYGRFERSIALPHNIDAARAEVSYSDGVVTVIVPKTEALPPRDLPVG